jgi:hypothetical protein
MNYTPGGSKIKQHNVLTNVKQLGLNEDAEA